MAVPYQLTFLRFLFLCQTICCQILLKYCSDQANFCLKFSITTYCPQATVNDLTWDRSPWLSSLYLFRTWTLPFTSPFTSPTLPQSCFSPPISCSLNLIKISLFLLFFWAFNSRPCSNPSSKVQISEAFYLNVQREIIVFYLILNVLCISPTLPTGTWLLRAELILIYFFNSYNSCHSLCA